MMSRRLLLVVVLLAVSLLGGCVGFETESPAPLDLGASGRWVALAPMPTPRQEVAVAALGGHVWVIGGFVPGAEPVPTVERYDAASNSWDARPPLPLPIHHPAAAVVDDRLYVLGGYTGGRIRWTALDDVWEWTEARGTWEKRTPMPTARGTVHGRRKPADTSGKPPTKPGAASTQRCATATARCRAASRWRGC